VEECLGLANSHGISMPEGVTMLTRGMLTIQGVLASLAPELNLVQIMANRMLGEAARDFDLLARNDHIGTVRERAPERFVGFAAHDHGVPRRDGLEMFQVFGNMPEQRILIPDHAVFGNGNDDANHKFQILTSGGIAAAYNNAGTAGRGLRPLRTTSAP